MSRYARLLGPIDGIEGNAEEAVPSLIERFVKDVRDAGEHGVMQLCGGNRDPDERLWGISLHRAARARGEEVERPDFTVAASLDTCRRMIDGSYSPVDAFREGKLRICGKISPQVTRRLFAQ